MKKEISVLLIAFSASIGVANANEGIAKGVFQIGPQIGYSDFDASVSDGSVNSKTSVDDKAVGLIARYTVPLSTDGLFVGIEAGIAKEFASDEEVSGTITGNSSVEWTADLMPRVGYKLGKASLSLTGGLSLLQGKSGISGGPLPAAESDTQWHVGWKIAPAIDYEISERVSLFAQVHYAKYNSQTYSLAGAGLTVKPKTVGIRTGVLFSF